MPDPFSIRWVERCADVADSVWDACFPPPLEGRWWYETLERSGLEDQFAFAYAVVERGGEIVGVAPTFVMDVPMDLVAPPVLAKVLRVGGRVVRRLNYQRTLFVGSPAADEGAVGLRAGATLAAVAPALQAALRARARSAGAAMVVWKDFPAGPAREALAPLADGSGLFRCASYPGTRVPLPEGGFEAYLARSLDAHKRSNLRRKLKKSRAAGPLDAAVVQHPDAATVDEVFGLFWQTYEKGKTKFEKLDCRFFERTAELPQAHWVLLRHGGDGPRRGRLAAFMLCYLAPPYVINKFIGLDYALDGDWFLYFRLWEAAVAWASSVGAREIQSGQTGYSAKLDLGHALIPLDNYCRHRNPVLNAVFARVARGITWETLDEQLAGRSADAAPSTRAGA